MPLTRLKMRVYHWKSNVTFPLNILLAPFFLYFFFAFSLSPSLSFKRARRSIRIKIAVGPARGRNPRVPDRESKNGNRGLISIRPYHFRFAFPTIALPFPTDVSVLSVSLVFAIKTRACSLSEYITSRNSYKYKTKLPPLSFIPIGA